MTDLHSLEGIAEYAQQQIEKIERMQRDLADRVGEGRSRDGLVTAKTGIAGGMRELRIEPAALRLSVEELSAEVMSAITAAQADYARGADDVMAPILGMRPSEDATAAFESRLSKLEAIEQDVERLARSRDLLK